MCNRLPSACAVGGDERQDRGRVDQAHRGLGVAAGKRAQLAAGGLGGERLGEPRQAGRIAGSVPALDRDAVQRAGRSEGCRVARGAHGGLTVAARVGAIDRGAVAAVVPQVGQVDHRDDRDDAVDQGRVVLGPHEGVLAVH